MGRISSSLVERGHRQLGVGRSEVRWVLLKSAGAEVMRGTMTTRGSGGDWIERAGHSAGSLFWDRHGQTSVKVLSSPRICTADLLSIEKSLVDASGDGKSLADDRVVRESDGARWMSGSEFGWSGEGDVCLSSRSAHLDGW